MGLEMGRVAGGDRMRERESLDLLRLTHFIFDFDLCQGIWIPTLKELAENSGLMKAKVVYLVLFELCIMKKSMKKSK